MSDSNIKPLDVRTMPPRERHPQIFAQLDALQTGEAIQLINDHDPKPLYYQVMAERAGMFSWVPEVEGPEEWHILITRQ